MVIVLGIIAVLLLLSVVYLQRFMRNMAVVESELIKELREMKVYLKKMSEKSL
jgi:low affinity Fe/Cu permease